MEDGKPKMLSARQEAALLFEKYKKLEPMFGLEQEFFMIDVNTNMPFGFKKQNSTTEVVKWQPNGEYNNSYYCGIGAKNVNNKTRLFMNQVLLMAAKMNLNITGMNLEVAPGQGEFQVCNVGIKACDELMMLRYLLVRLGEDYGIHIDFSPKLSNPLLVSYNGSGCHINFSTKSMREENGYDEIKNCIDKLNSRPKTEHLKYYGDNNRLRLLGTNETSKYDDFTVGVANRGCSIRIPTSTVELKKGYFEDRRPGANINPYVACPYLLNCYVENV